MNSSSSTSHTAFGDGKPAHEHIAVRATLLWKAYGSPLDRDEEIWLEAERQLLAEAPESVGRVLPAASLAPLEAPAKETEITASLKAPKGGRAGKRR